MHGQSVHLLSSFVFRISARVLQLEKASVSSTLYRIQPDGRGEEERRGESVRVTIRWEEGEQGSRWEGRKLEDRKEERESKGCERIRARGGGRIESSYMR